MPENSKAGPAAQQSPPKSPAATKQEKTVFQGTPTSLAERLIAAGIPVVVCRPCPGYGKPGRCKWHDDGNRDLHVPKGWNTVVAADCDLSGFRPGVDALALVGGHGIDLVDVDTKADGSVTHLPPFVSYGMTRTPSGGEHYVVPSSGFGKVGNWGTELGFVGDYVGGKPDGSSRLLGYLPGSTRPKYPAAGYVEEVLWDIEGCLAAQPDPALIAALEAAGGSRAPRPGHYVDDSPLRPVEDGVHGYAAAAIAEELRKLDELDLLGLPNWDTNSFNVACNLIEFANSNWSGYTLEQAEDDFLAHAPTDDGFGPAKHEEKWESALNTVGFGGRRNPDLDDLTVWEPSSSTPILDHIRQAAHARLVSAPALLAYVLGRVLLDVPVSVQLPPTIGSPASLNLGVAVVGGSGSGKSALLDVSRELLGMTGLDQLTCEKQIGSGEGLIQTFLRRDKETKTLVLDDDPRRLILVDEIDQLGALGQRSGATIGPTIRSALTGGQLGTENADMDRKRNVPAKSYRLVLFAGVQPTRSAALLEDSDAGTPQRFVWVPAADPTIPDAEVPWPGALDWSPPEVKGFLDYPDHIKAVVRKARLAQQRGGGDELDGHLILLRLKLAGALALLHGETSITDQWWELAGRLVTASRSLQERCKAVIAAEGQRRSTGAAIAATRAQDAAEDDRLTRCSQLVLKKVQGAKGEWLTRHEARPSTASLRDYVDDAIELLRLAGQVDVDEYVNRGKPGVRLRVKA